MEVPMLSGVHSLYYDLQRVTSPLNEESLSLSGPKNQYLTDPIFYHLAACSF